LGNAQLNILSDVKTLILFDAIDPNFTDGIEDVANHRILPGVAGYYYFSASIVAQTISVAKDHTLHVARNPGAITIAQDSRHSGMNFNLALAVSDVCYLAANQWLDVYYMQHDSDNVDVLAYTNMSWLSVQRVR